MMRSLAVFTLLAIVSVAVVKSEKPFWVIANMANNISEAENFLSKGANGLEIDVQFTLNGTPTFTYHGSPCGCGRNCGGFQVFSDFVDFIKLKTTPGMSSYNPHFAIVHMNLRVSGLVQNAMYRAGKNIADVLINNLYSKGKSFSKVWIVLGVPFLSQTSVFTGLRDTFKGRGMQWQLGRIGYDVYHFGRLERLSTTLKDLGISDRIWAGTGSHVCHRRFVPDRLLNLVMRREVYDKFGDYMIDKVYYWVADEASVIEEALRLGVDAIMTNRPSAVREIMALAKYQNKLRMADNGDVPWRVGDKKQKKKKHQFNLLLSKEEDLSVEHRSLLRDLDDDLD